MMTASSGRSNVMRPSRRLLTIALILAGVAGCTASFPSSPSPTVVFFEADSAALAGPAQELVRSAAAGAARRPHMLVRVLGFADTDNSALFSQALSRARAEHVADLLREAGVAPGRIRVEARGPVPSELLEQEARRVEVRVGE